MNKIVSHGAAGSTGAAVGFIGGVVLCAAVTRFGIRKGAEILGPILSEHLTREQFEAISTDVRFLSIKTAYNNPSGAKFGRTVSQILTPKP